MRIAIATPSPRAKRETFIDAHVRLLRRVELVLEDGLLPAFDGAGRPLLGDSVRDRLLFTGRSRLLGKDRRAQLIVRIATLLRAKCIDALLCEYGMTAMELLPAARRASVPVVAHFHGLDAGQEDAIARYGSYAALWQHAAGIVAVSDAQRDRLLALGAPAEKLHVSPYGVDVRPAVSDPASAPPLLLAVGRFTEKKAPLLLLAAFKRVAEARSAARLMIIGDGDLWPAAQDFVQAEGLSDRVELPGRLAHAEVLDRMTAARAFVQHSITARSGDAEGMPVAILEAMMIGLPVVSTRHMGIAESVVEGRTGLLCDEYDVEFMARNMITMIDDPALAARMGAAGRARALEHYVMADSIARLQEILRRCAHQR